MVSAEENEQARAMTSPTQARRSTTNRILGGVCGGLADYTNTDPLLWRLGFVALGLAGPGLIVYVLLWILMPEGTSGSGKGSGTLDGVMDRLRYGNAGTPPADGSQGPSGPVAA